MAMLASFVKASKPVWGVALSPSKFSILKVELENDDKVTVQHYTKLCDVTKPFNL